MGETETLTLTRAKILITDSNTAFTETISTTSLAAPRALISAFNAAHVAERAPTSGRVSPAAQGSNVVMIQSGGEMGGGEETVGSLTIGHSTHMTQILRMLSANSLREGRRPWPRITLLG